MGREDQSIPEILIFELAEQRCAFALCEVRELLRAVTITPLPHAPDIVEGIVNVRGTVVPVLDLRARLRLPPKPVEPTDCLILAHVGERVVAIRADRAIGFARLEPEDIDTAIGKVPGVEYVAGAAKLPDALVVIHDLRDLLSRSEASALDGALPAVEATGCEG